MRSGTAFRRPTWAPPTNATGSSSWPTPNAEGGTGYMSGSNRDTWRPTLESAARLADAGLPTNWTAEEWRQRWPTPKASNGDKAGRPRENDRGDLQAEALRWPTSQARDGDGRGADPNRVGDPARHGGYNLDDWVQRWATPTARDWRSEDMPGRQSPSLPVQVNEQRWATPKASDGGPDYAKTQRAKDDPRGSASLSLPTQAGGALNPAWVEGLQGFPEGWTVIAGHLPRARSNTRGSHRGQSKPGPSPTEGSA
jgi:hypothetical protein